MRMNYFKTTKEGKKRSLGGKNDVLLSGNEGVHVLGG